jgi:hypothetical protein
VCWPGDPSHGSNMGGKAKKRREEEYYRGRIKYNIL